MLLDSIIICCGPHLCKLGAVLLGQPHPDLCARSAHDLRPRHVLRHHLQQLLGSFLRERRRRRR